MIGGNVKQHCDVAIECLRQVDLVAGQFQHVDPACRKRRLREDRQADIAAHQAGDARGLQDVVDERGSRRLAVGAGDADDLVRWKIAAGLREEFDIADDGNAGGARLRRERVGVERHAGGHDERVEAGEVVKGGDREKPLPFRGGVGVGATGVGLDETLPTPNPSLEGEGL